MLAVLAVLSASLALLKDFKLINGKMYKNATISRIEVDGIVFRTKTGISKVYFVELPKDVQDRFHYGPAMPVAKQHQHEAIKLEGKQDGPSQADASGWTGWAAAMGDPAIFITVFATRTVIIAGVVFAIVRTRSQRQRSDVSKSQN
jgi:hypothetical protein